MRDEKEDERAGEREGAYISSIDANATLHLNAVALLPFNVLPHQRYHAFSGCFSCLQRVIWQVLN